MNTSSGRQKIAVAGAAGMLGGYLLAELKKLEAEVLPFDVGELDITQAAAVEEYLSRHRPRILINAAAKTDVNGCETGREAAFAVNAEGVKNLAAACAKTGAVMLQVSTDYIFDGRKGAPYQEEDEPDPLSVYGASKLAGEKYLRRIMKKYYLVRTAWLYGRGGVNFVDKIIQLGRVKDSLRVVDDQTGSPTYAKDLARAIVKLINTEAYGVYHFTGGGYCTWYELAREAFKLAGLDPLKISPCGAGRFPQPAARPAFSVLDNTRGAALGVTLRPWREALADYLINDKVERPG